MFRFVDVLPMLSTSEAVTRHLHEYFQDVREYLPSAVRLGLAVATPRSIAGRALALAARRNAMGHARRFIAGTTQNEVLAAAMRERKLRRAFTLDILGEAVTSEPEADHYLQAYVDLIEGTAPIVNAWPEVPQIDRDASSELPRVNVSVKLSALDSQFDPIDPPGTTRRVAERLRRLLRVAAAHRAFVNIDMESYRTKDLTLAIFQQVLSEDEFRDSTDVGIVIQCYLRDAADDLRKLRDWAAERGRPVWVRLVKGAYWDYETVLAGATGWPIPVFRNKWETDANYEATDSVRDAASRTPAAGAGQPQPALAGPRHGHGPALGSSAGRFRVANAVRHGRRRKAGAGRPRLPAADLHALRRTDPRHGLPGAPAVGEHFERIVPAGQFCRARLGGDIADEPSRSSRVERRRAQRPRLAGSRRAITTSRPPISAGPRIAPPCTRRWPRPSGNGRRRIRW